MRKLFQHIRIEALLFLVFAALIWFVMTVSATTLERQYTINFTADASVVDVFWMQDSTIAALVTVQSEGQRPLYASVQWGRYIFFGKQCTSSEFERALYVAHGFKSHSYGTIWW